MRSHEIFIRYHSLENLKKGLGPWVGFVNIGKRSKKDILNLNEDLKRTLISTMYRVIIYYTNFKHICITLYILSLICAQSYKLLFKENLLLI